MPRYNVIFTPIQLRDYSIPAHLNKRCVIGIIESSECPESFIRQLLKILFVNEHNFHLFFSHINLATNMKYYHGFSISSLNSISSSCFLIRNPSMSIASILLSTRRYLKLPSRVTRSYSSVSIILRFNVWLPVPRKSVMILRLTLSDFPT